MTERGPEPLIEEALNLACHGARAQDQNFNIALERDLDPTLSRIKVVPQDVTRVFLNLIGNGFYAANKRSREAGDDLGPLLQGVHAFTILPPRKIAPKCDLPHIPSKLPSHTFASPALGELPAAPPCYSMRAATKKLGNKGLPVVHSWPQIRICVKDIVS